MSYLAQKYPDARIFVSSRRRVISNINNVVAVALNAQDQKALFDFLDRERIDVMADFMIRYDMNAFKKFAPEALKNEIASSINNAAQANINLKYMYIADLFLQKHCDICKPI